MEALSHKQNLKYMTRIRSAVKQGQRPTAALLYEPNPHKGWTKLDYLIQDAFFTMDSEICPMCNNPIWLCHSTDNRIDFKVSTRTCYAKAEIEDFENSEKGKRLDSGEYVIAKPIGIEDERGEFEDLPTRSEAYKKMQTS